MSILTLLLAAAEVAELEKAGKLPEQQQQAKQEEKPQQPSPQLQQQQQQQAHVNVNHQQPMHWGPPIKF